MDPSKFYHRWSANRCRSKLNPGLHVTLRDLIAPVNPMAELVMHQLITFTLTPASPLGSKYFSCSFHAVFGKKWQNNRVAHSLWELAPPWGKSWIRHCFNHYTTHTFSVPLISHIFENIFLKQAFTVPPFLPTTREGNVFTGVCDPVHNRSHGYLFTTHPCYCAVGTHPTGMLSWIMFCLHPSMLFFCRTNARQDGLLLHRHGLIQPLR